MPFASARSARSSRSSRAIGTATDLGSGDVEHAGGADSLTMSDALITAREGVLGYVADEPAAPPDPADRWPDASRSTPADRLFRLSDTERAAVLLSELVEGSAVTTTDPRWCTVRLPAAAGPVDLLRIARPGPAVFDAAAALVEDYAELREDRLPEIHVQISDQLSFFGSVTPLQPAGFRDTLQLLSALLDHVTMVAQRIKLHLGAVRPEVLSPRVQPVIQTPSHGSYPSGHAAQAFAVAELLVLMRHPACAARLATGAALSEPARQIYRMASRIAINRTVAGVHYPVDSAAGALIGRSLARALWARTGAALDLRCVTFDGDTYVAADGGARDFHIGEYAALVRDAQGGAAAPALTPAPMVAALAARARAEWATRW